jgi:hypothetical protein
VHAYGVLLVSAHRDTGQIGMLTPRVTRHKGDPQVAKDVAKCFRSR